MENVIKIHLRDKKDYQNSYNGDILSHKLRNYILDEVKAMEKDFSIVVTSDFEMFEQDRENFCMMIRESFGTDIRDILVLSRRQRIANLTIFLLGLIFLLIYTFFKVAFLSEFILILGWVLLGEAICNFLYNGVENRMKMRKRKRIVNAKIIFEDKKKI